MTDEKNQSKLGEPMPRYRALQELSGFVQKGSVFRVITALDECKLYDGLKSGNFYRPDTGKTTPILHIQDLINSPDFELIEELWEPEIGEDYTFLLITTNKQFGQIHINQYDTERRIEEDKDFYQKFNGDAPIFRTKQDTQNCIEEVMELIKKRSKESRRL